MTTDKTLTPEIGLSERNRQGVVSILNTVLADEYTLYTRLRNYHWNVTGPQFHSLHEMFEEQYEQFAELKDDVAERVRSYGEFAIGTMQEFLEATRLSEKPGEYPEARQMVIDLVDDHEAMIRHLRDDIERVGSDYNDVGAEDFLTALLQEHQEMAWMLRTFIEGAPTHT